MGNPDNESAKRASCHAVRPASGEVGGLRHGGDGVLRRLAG
ncbi:MAG TPA: hypothetical protein VNE18_11325 [Rhodanobacter sp.]|nr:hypothetical protein [Rhodanobacter sp.]